MQQPDPSRDPAGSSVFSGQLLNALGNLGREQTYEKGETLFLQDDPGEFVILLSAGLVEISVTSLAGRKSVLAHCGAGEVIGEISVLDGLPRSADVTALRPTTGRVIRQSEVLAYLSSDPDAMQEVIVALCGRIRNASGMFATQALTSASARLARCILRLADKFGDPVGDAIHLREPFSQTELGAFSGLARENVNRHIRRWCQEGILAFDQHRIEILDEAQLTVIAEL